MSMNLYVLLWNKRKFYVNVYLLLLNAVQIIRIYCCAII